MEVNWRDLYSFGLRAGAASLRAGDAKIGIKSICNPLRSGYNRYIEAPYVINRLELRPADSVLDISSPKHVALFIRDRFSCKVTSIDIMPDFIDDYSRYERNLGLNGIIWGTEDARRLRFSENAFDKAYSISVLEHIPNGGDSIAAQEIGRVLKPGGICVITVPFSKKYKELYKKEDVYERKSSGEPLFFARFYDEDALERMLIIPSGLKETHRRYYRNILGVEAFWNRLPSPAKMALHWAGPVFAGLSYKKAASADAVDDGFCCITLKKEARSAPANKR